MTEHEQYIEDANTETPRIVARAGKLTKAARIYISNAFRSHIPTSEIIAALDDRHSELIQAETYRMQELILHYGEDCL